MDEQEGKSYYATKRFTAEHFTIKADEDEGTVEAVFSTFGIIDRDGDVVAKGAIPEVEVPIAWGHDWRAPVGRGHITTTRKEAKLTGRFFMSTAAGVEAFNTVKEMADLQQWSWGFSVLEWEFAEVDGVEGVRVIKKTEPFEVSPVIVGANQETRTVAVKDWRPPAGYKWAVASFGESGDIKAKILIPDDLGGDTIKLVTSSEPAEADASSGAPKSNTGGDDGGEAGEGDDADVGLGWTQNAQLEMAGAKYRED